MSKQTYDTSWGEIKVSMGPDGIWFQGRLEDCASDQAREAYLRIADVVAQYVDDADRPYQKLTKIKNRVLRNQEGACE